MRRRALVPLLLLPFLPATARAQGAPDDPSAQLIETLIRHIAPCRGDVPVPPDAVLEFEVQVDASGRVLAVRPAYRRPPMRQELRPLYEELRRAFLDPRCGPLPLTRQQILLLNRSILVFYGNALRRS
ncbi:hypothetical protein MVG78_06370 [Roseomonas gilardii subsp. gilardii]|uniref:hypothetical protein n=1 Tax=Roseomonas gilardii TaxID=257708 RepID=UPI001FF7D125|nr:hypothetical protein [Roseomonas gilardii]UPG73762.1 hypothetical protein MVG78_06370 [Roseomonas gilardii subsp. gilardii]